MKLIILDRDGVINQDSAQYIKSPAEWLPIPQSLEAIALLNQHGYTISVATNQSGVARGYFTEKTLHEIHEKMHKALFAVGGKIDSIFYCPHGPGDDCDCRKPRPGLLYQIANYYKITLKDVPFVGDATRDIETAIKANAKPILVLTGKGFDVLQKNKQILAPSHIFQDLMSFAKNSIERHSYIK